MIKSKIKTVVMVVAILLCLALAGGWIAQTVTNKQKVPVQIQTGNAKDGMQVELENDKHEIQFLSALIAPEDYDEYGVSALTETAYTLNATITPESEDNKSLTWSLSFVNPSSSWANGRSPSNYVTLTSSGTQATVSCRNAFGEPIYITATSTLDSTKSARCTLNYKQKVAELSFQVGGTTYYPHSGGYMYDDGRKLGECRIFPTFAEPLNDSYSITMTKSDTYTVPAGNIQVKFEFVPTETLLNELVQQGYDTAQLLQYTVTANADKTGKIENYLDTVWAENIAGETLTASVRSALISDMQEMDTVVAYNLNCYIGDLTKPVYTYDLYLDFSRIPKVTTVDNVTFDRSEIEF